MRISHRYQFIFFANPKTGSSTIRQFLNPYSDVIPVRNYQQVTSDNPFYPHMTPAETRTLFHQFGWDFEGYIKFVFVRNPWARLVSLYEHIHRKNTHPAAFSEWLYTIKPYETGGGGEVWERWRRYGAYSIEHFIKDQNGAILVDKVIRLEDIDHALLPFLQALGLPVNDNISLAHKNKRASVQHYSSYYNDETAAHVGDLYRYDIVNYGYQFDV